MATESGTRHVDMLAGAIAKGDVSDDGYKLAGYVSRRSHTKFLDWNLYHATKLDLRFTDKYPLASKWEIYRSFSDTYNNFGFIAVSKVSGAIKFLEDFVWDDDVEFEFAWTHAYRTIHTAIINDEMAIS